MPFQIDEFTTVQTKRRMYYVNLYLQDRQCFGPEEGGNWQTVGSFEQCLGKNLDLQAAEIIQFSNQPRLAEMNEGRPSISSVLSRGQYVILIEPYPGQNYPLGPVHYE